MRVVAVLVGLVIALDLMEATALVGAVVGAAGVVGLALGFALRDLVENYVAGVLLSVRQPFAPGDHVVVDDNEGKVVALTTRSTTLITLDGNHLRLPNSLVFKGVILNYTRNPLRRFTFRVGIGNGVDIGHAHRLGLDTLAHVPGVLAQPAPLALVLELGDSAVVIEFSGWFDQRRGGFHQVRSASMRAVKEAFDHAGVVMPEPGYRVQLLAADDAEEVAAPRAPRSAPATPGLGPTPAPARGPARATAPHATPSVEQLVDEQVAQEVAASAGRNLLKPGAARE